MSRSRTYPVSENEILKISQLVTAFESAVKAIIRTSGGLGDGVADFHEIEFYRCIAEISPGKDDKDSVEFEIF